VGSVMHSCMESREKDRDKTNPPFPRAPCFANIRRERNRKTRSCPPLDHRGPGEEFPSSSSRRNVIEGEKEARCMMRERMQDHQMLSRSVVQKEGRAPENHAHESRRMRRKSFSMTEVSRSPPASAWRVCCCCCCSGCCCNC